MAVSVDYADIDWLDNPLDRNTADSMPGRPGRIFDREAASPTVSLPRI